MKTRCFFLPLLMLVVLLSACAGDATEPSDKPMEGFDFTEEEAIELSDEGGFDFTEEEALDVDAELGFDFDEDEVDEPPGMDFDDDEAQNLPDLPDQLFPPNGASNWLIKHHDGTATCPSQTIPIWGKEPEMVTISLGADAATLVVSGMEGGPDIVYLLEGSGPGGSIYNGYFQPPGASSEIHYQILFSSVVDGSFADFLYGSISAEEQGCKISRNFDGNRVD